MDRWVAHVVADTVENAVTVLVMEKELVIVSIMFQ